MLTVKISNFNWFCLCDVQFVIFNPQEIQKYRSISTAVRNYEKLDKSCDKTSSPHLQRILDQS